MNTVVNQMLATGIALGSNLGLFDALADVGSQEKPATPKDVADKANCKERYVKEWLGAMACGDIIEVTQDEQFYIKPEHVQVRKILNDGFDTLHLVSQERQFQYRIVLGIHEHCFTRTLCQIARGHQ
ncbi:hypothetical protein WR25_13777 [Diploscapter pachys]|uniref:S-adenosylmethionine-dependent methyltransferase Rv2258c-like winged HTH domain-containing protein n=1 Tax=Diploscapter pachys TaxID=2018661 RepID=A0A2A2JHY2_9BILA|nr:hypothetical protein WR25_13777 [Diploscapter pachys]